MKVNRGLMDRLWRRQGYCCPRCGGWLFVNVPGSVHLDHVLSIANGGPHEEENLQLLHSKCNLTKGSQ
jgi:5-methylcytosine-specific restriction endonuclease McrA